jgi:CheY-like chemotaxis protein
MSRGLLLCDDLIFTSKVTGTARALGLEVKAARDTRTLLDLARQETPSCVLIDLHNPGLDLNALLAELRAVCPALPRVVGYGSHVEAATLHAARVAGCDPVLPRSRFVEELPASRSCRRRCRGGWNRPRARREGFEGVAWSSVFSPRIRSRGNESTTAGVLECGEHRRTPGHPPQDLLPI